MRVVVAARQAEVRSAVRLLVTQNLGMQVVDEALNASSLWTHIQDARPDLLLLEWELLGAEASAGLARLHALYPRLHIIVLSGHPETRQQALAAHADAFVSTADSAEQMIKILKTARAYIDTGSAADHTSTMAEDTRAEREKS
jgi:DNA-binding NarL/FixJ family response regulator